MQNEYYESDLNSLDEFIEMLSKYYVDMCNEWISENKCTINLKKNNLSSVFKFSISGKDKYEFFDNDFLRYIEKYLNFLNEKMIYSPPFDSKFNNINVSSRVKAINSLLYKIIYYCVEKKEKGSVEINKCINDLQGYRVILDINCEYDVVVEHLKKFIAEFSDQYKDVGIKCIEAHRGNNDYNAVHVYMRKTKNNCVFRWELQIWLKKYEKSNLESHALHKQGYTKWELEIKNMA